MAFFAPGTYNVMGCRLMQDQGLPVFHFPGTIFVPAPVVMPWGLKHPLQDTFYWPTGGQYPSFVRIYAAPTLTMQLGIAICIGQMDTALRLPKPFADVTGNCFVTKVPLPVAGCQEDDGADES